MTDLDTLLRAVLLSPGDDLARLAYADALDEAGQADRAAFVRWQLAGGGVKTLAWSRGWLPPSLRCLEWGASSGGHYVHLGGPHRSYVTAGVELLYHRGLVERAAFDTWADYGRHAPGLFAAEPVLAAHVVDRRPAEVEVGRGAFRGHREAWALSCRGEAGKAPSAVPRELWGWPGWDRAARRRRLRLYPIGRSEAALAMSSALVWYGRTLAGLPPLPA